VNAAIDQVDDVVSKITEPDNRVDHGEHTKKYTIQFVVCIRPLGAPIWAVALPTVGELGDDG
jgi:hypothetical protein